VDLVGAVDEVQRAGVYIDASGQSSETPAPPKSWIARSITLVATRAAATLIAAISMRAPLLPTVSMSQAALRTSSRACSISMRDSAMRSWTTPCSASGLPNGVRSHARSHISSSAFSARPTARMQWWIRPGPSRACAIANPPPSSPRRFDAGRRTSSYNVSQWPPPASCPNTGNVRTTRTPGASIGTRIIDWRWYGSASGFDTPRRIATLQRSDAAPLVHHLCALTT
jgi:hypothetical protein